MVEVEKGSAQELAALFPAVHKVEVLEPLPSVPQRDKHDTEDAYQEAINQWEQSLPDNRRMTTVIVRPLNAMEAAHLVVALKPLFDAYDPAKPVVTLVAEQGPAIMELAAVATNRTGDYLTRLDAGDGTNVMVHVVMANQNFLRRVVDLVAGPTGKTLAMLFSVGPMHSPISRPEEASPPRKPLSSYRARSKA